MTTDQTDPFGFPSLPGGEETLLQRRMRQAKARRAGEIGFGALFARLKAHLGPERAQRIFLKYVAAVSKPPRNLRTRRRGRENPERDAYLLDEYDAAKAEAGGTEPSIEKLSEQLFSTKTRMIAGQQVDLGNSALAIEKHLRRILKARKQKEEAAAAWCQAIAAGEP